MTTAALLFVLIATPNAGAAREPILLDFQASWCGPCQQMRPAVDQLVRNGYPIKAIDIDNAPALAERYRVSSVPTFVVVDPTGRALARTEGYQPAAQLAAFYREARAKYLSSRSSGSRSEREERRDDDAEDQEEEEDAKAESPASATTRNPMPWESVVRIKVDGNGAIGFGSGTIISSTAEESIILTCAHIFKLEGSRQAHPSRFPRRIRVDLFDGKLSTVEPRQVHYVETVEGKAVDYDFSRDVGLIRIRPGRRLPASRVVPAEWKPQPGMRMTTVGCSEGQDATAWSTSIIKSGIRLFDNSSYEAIECLFAPKQGRSGGGLYTTSGHVAGVCDFAEPRGRRGFYATPRSIHYILDRNRLTALYSPATRRGGALLAQDHPPAAKRASAPSIARAQSPDRDESIDVMIPPPELLGIKAPGMARAAKGSTAGAKSGWHAPRSRGPASEPFEQADLMLPPSVDNDRFDPIPPQSARRTNSASENAPDRNPSGRWRPVRQRQSSLSANSAG